jgi:hypothetical protein
MLRGRQGWRHHRYPGVRKRASIYDCVVCESARAFVWIRMKKFSFFSLFFLRECNRNVTRSHKKTSACLCVKAPRQDIFDSREKKKKKTTRWFWSRQRQKSQTTLSFIYRSTEKDDTNGQIRFRVVMVRPVLLLSRWPPMLCARVKRGKRCSCLQSKCTRVDFFFFFGHRVERDQHPKEGTREREKQQHLSDGNVRRRCLVRALKCKLCKCPRQIKKKRRTQ